MTTDSHLCPTCRRPLTGKRVASTEIETCARCRAFWLPPSVLERSIETLEGNRTPSGLQFQEARLGSGPATTGHCPIDDTPLRTAYWGDARLARCDACGGIWITKYMVDTIRHQLAAAPNVDADFGWMDLLDLLPF